MSVLSRAADRLDPEPWTPPGRASLEDHQRPPDGRWDLWLMLAGRGAGKTEACCRYFTQWMRDHAGARGRIIAPTFGDAVESCIDGPSGLKSVDPQVEWHPSLPGGSKVVWPNGSEALVLGTSTKKNADRLRAAGNRHLDWWEEMAANPQLEYAWTQADLGLRLGEHPHAVASTTPRNRPKLVELAESDGTAVTTATTYDNPHNPQSWVDRLEERYSGTRLERQEIGGEIVPDAEGALWNTEMVAASRVAEPPDLLDRIAVGVDPPGGAGTCGIVAVGLSGRHIYILGDYSMTNTSPDGWASRVTTVADSLGAQIVAEKNQGQRMVVAVLEHADAGPVHDVWASEGKQARAAPVALLWEQDPPRGHVVGQQPKLEAQLTGWIPGSGESPDRLDAMVWAATWLKPSAGKARIRKPSTRVPA